MGEAARAFEPSRRYRHWYIAMPRKSGAQLGMAVDQQLEGAVQQYPIQRRLDAQHQRDMVARIGWMLLLDMPQTCLPQRERRFGAFVQGIQECGFFRFEAGQHFGGQAMHRPAYTQLLTIRPDFNALCTKFLQKLMD